MSVCRAALLTVLLLPSAALGCDICAVYTGYDVQATEIGLRLGIAEQYTDFGTLQNSSVEVPNPNGEYLLSSITQLLVGYQLHPRLGLHLVVPVISRTFRRTVIDGVQSGDVSGLGDISLLFNVLPYTQTTTETVALVSVFGGLQLPTGNSFPLSEEVPAPAATPCHGRDCLDQTLFSGKHIGMGDGVDSGIHGHDLALGSGAVDVLMGMQGFASWKRLYGTASLQYSLRSAGSFDYQYANELIAGGGPGLFLLLDDDYTLGFQALMTMETKGNDTVGGVSTNDTGFTGFYVGPAFRFTWTNKLSADIAADLPAIQNNSGLQIVPDYRVRLGMVWRF